MAQTMIPAGLCFLISLSLIQGDAHDPVLTGIMAHDPVLSGIMQRKMAIQRRVLETQQLSHWASSSLLRSLMQRAATEPPPAESVTGQQVRLAGGTGPWHGLLEVYTATGWRKVRASRWSEHEAGVVCRQLGYTSYFAKTPEAWRVQLPSSEEGAAYVDIDECQGEESSVLDCVGADVTDSRLVGVGCLTADDLTARCGPGELPFGDNCYYIGTESVTRLKADIKCQLRGARLVAVNSQLKNDFLSGVLLLNGSDGFHTSGRSYQLHKKTSAWIWMNSTQPFSFTKWGPDGSGMVKGGPQLQRCLTVEPVLLEDGSQYSFWKPSDCSRRLQYVCQKPRSWTECASGRAHQYTGTVRTAQSDRPCLSWSSVAGFPGLVSPTLSENFCRNPDGDQRPWCFTSAEQYEYCDVPACPPHIPDLVPEEIHECRTSLQFQCSPKECTRIKYICDGDRDCDNGRDESICEVLAASYQRIPDKTFKLSFENLNAVFSKYSKYGLRPCQHLCLVDPSCRAIMYDTNTSNCFTTHLPLGALQLKTSGTDDVYVVLSRSEPCPGFQCSDLSCVNKTAARCDGALDCDDLSDEIDCQAELGPTSLRLVDGNAPGTGRLEAHHRGRWGAVCDDKFGITEANMACRQLGFDRVQRFFVNGRGYPAGPDPENYVITRTLCFGNETMIGQCVLVHSNGSCVQNEHVSVECTNATGKCTLIQQGLECLDSSFCIQPVDVCDGIKDCTDESDESADLCQEDRFRFVGDRLPRRVEAKPSPKPFLALTSLFITEMEANYLCKQLGGDRYGVPVEDTGRLPRDQLVAQLTCSSPDDCQLKHRAPLASDSPVGVRCVAERPPPAQLRLTAGSSGLLELRPPHGHWGRVCALSFNAAQAQVACRQLGFSGASDFLEAQRNPNVSVSLRAMDCLGNEASIADCVRLPWLQEAGPNACRGGGEVYLVCEAPEQRPESVQVAARCRVETSDLNRVLGGTAGRLQDHPWHAHVDVIKNSSPTLRCGATLISSRFVLTAAHCLLERKLITSSEGKSTVDEKQIGVNRLSVVVGDGGSSRTNRNRHRIPVRRTHLHPGHRALTPQHNDIALVELARAAPFSEHVQPACLPSPDVSYSPDMVCSVAGLGRLSHKGALPDALQVGNVTLFTRAQCQQFYGRRNVTLGMVCAGTAEFDVDTCDGDSGGPLTCDLGGTSAIMGITSWGIACGKKSLPGVYTRVTTYLPWIRDVIQTAKGLHSGDL